MTRTLSFPSSDRAEPLSTIRNLERDSHPSDVVDIDDPRVERRLLRAMDRGDEQAFEQFVALYTPALVRFARAQLVRQPDMVPDIVQGTLAEAIEKLDSFRGDGPLGAWLIGICRFRIGSLWRRQSVRKRFAADLPVELDHLEAPDEAPTRALERQEQRASVHGTLELLPPPYGQVLEWKYLEELSVKAIAGRLGISPKAAESTLTRARSAFRKLFAAVGNDRGDS